MSRNNAEYFSQRKAWPGLSCLPSLTLFASRGRDYCAVIEEAAAGRYQIIRPMQGLGIGYQLQWLKANAKEAA